ncbi:hypothetical protein D9M68_721080 [compost metagenome]
MRLLVLDEGFGERLDREWQIADWRVEARAGHRIRGAVALVQMGGNLERGNPDVDQIHNVHVDYVNDWKPRRFEAGCIARHGIRPRPQQQNRRQNECNCRSRSLSRRDQTEQAGDAMRQVFNRSNVILCEAFHEQERLHLKHERSPRYGWIGIDLESPDPHLCGSQMLRCIFYSCSILPVALLHNADPLC